MTAILKRAKNVLTIGFALTLTIFSHNTLGAKRTHEPTITHRPESHQSQLRPEGIHFLSILERLVNGQELPDQLRYEILNWSLNRAPILQTLSPAEAASLKIAVDELFKSKLSVENIETFLSEFHFFNLHQIYQNLNGQGHLYDILAEKESALYRSGLTSSDRDIIREYLKTRSFDVDQIRELSISPIHKYAPNLELYSGFLSIDVLPIQSTGFRDGMAYGPPGSHQIERGIFTTSVFNNSLNWGLVKAKNMGLDASRKENAAVLKVEPSPDALVFDVPNGDLKRRVVQANYALTIMPESYKSRLTPSARLLISKPFLGLMSYFGASMFRATIFMDAGIGMGKEIVIADRSDVRRMTLLSHNGQPVDAASYEKIQNQAHQLSLKFVSHVEALIASERYEEAIAWVSDNAKAFGIRSPVSLSPLLRRLDPKRRQKLLKQLVVDSPKHNYIIPFLDSEVILDASLLKNLNYQEGLLHWISIGAKPVGTEDYLHTYSEAGYFTQILVDLHSRLAIASTPFRSQVVDMFGELDREIPRPPSLKSQAHQCMSLFSSATR
ncbi:MAG: hypothetical protein NDI61_01125 [Bdellovibrionaceae bacterium]|nr:hypothetical protein [Pseudobdellovibrionaceae bacterium]